MAKITVSPITYNITDANVNIVKIYFTSDVTLTDVKLSIDNGQNFLNNVSMTQTSADFNIANLVNKNYTCLLKGFYEETVTPSYSITNNLTHCTTSNTAKTINANSKYSTTINVEAGFTLNSITVTMGGKDITSSAVNNNVITISSVTGDVVITAKAIEQSTKPDIPDVPVVEDELEILPSCTYVDVAEGGSKTIYFKLSNKPTSNTTINISSSSSNLTTSTTQLTFTAENYYVAQSVNITSVADNNETDDVYTLTISSNGLTSKTITVDVIDSSNSNFEVIYDNGTLVDGASLSLSNAVNNGTYISTNQNQDVSVAISNHPLNLNKNDKVHVVLGLGTSEPSSIYSLRSLVLGDGSANNISNSNVINEVQINEALSNDGKVDTYWTIAGNLSNITLTFTCYFARVNIYKIYIERSE